MSISIYHFFILMLAIAVVSIGILLIINGIVTYSKNGGFDIGIGSLVIFLGSYLIFIRWAFGLLGHEIHLQAISGLAGIVAIVMGLILIQLMKDDSLYQKESIK